MARRPVDATGGQEPVGRLPRLRRFRPPLRLRLILGFGVTALVLASVLAGLAYALVRHSLVRDREVAALDGAYTNARFARSALRQPDIDPGELVAGVRVFGGGDALLRVGGEWFASSIDRDRRSLPEPLLAAVLNGEAGRQTTLVGGDPAVVVGVPIAEAGASYFEIHPLDDAENTLRVLGRSLAGAAAAAAVSGTLVGVSAGRAVLRPVRRVSAVARRIVDGDLESRLAADGDADLEPLVTSFNEMVDDLRGRIERETRFASDVAHELRGPLATLSAAVDVVNRRRAELSDDVTMALDALEDQVRAFNQLVLDLLEISRFDAGAASLNPSRVELVGFARQVVGELGADVPVLGPDRLDATVDPRRLHQMLTNLLQNAANYAGGATAVRIADAGDTVTIAVDDAGPGIDPAEAPAIFERFARGSVGQRPGAPRGSGLGLALVADHAALHGGRVEAGASPDGGARFLVELPKEPR